MWRFVQIALMLTVTAASIAGVGRLYGTDEITIWTKIMPEIVKHLGVR